MEVKVEAKMTGEEVVQIFTNFLKEHNIVAGTGNIKILALNSKGQEVEISPDKLNFVFNNN